MMIKAVIFDCFGVLVRASIEVFIHQHFHGNKEALERINQIDQQASRAQISRSQFIEAVAELAGMTSDQVKAELDQPPVNRPLLDFIRDELKPTLKIGMLSNAYSDWLDELFTPDQQSLFDDIVLSFRVGMAKPDPEIYQLSLKNLGVKAGEAVFIDDIQHYCQSAESLGIRAIHHRDNASTISQLQTMLAPNTR